MSKLSAGMAAGGISAGMAAGGIVVLFSLAACSGPPWTLSQSPAAIALRWYPDGAGNVAAEQIAELHCRSWGKVAELASDVRDGSAEIATYRCR